MSEHPHWSLGYFRAERYQVSVFCPDGHGRDIDLDRAIDRLGEGLILPEQRDRLLATWRCKICGKSGDSLIITPRSVGG